MTKLQKILDSKAFFIFLLLVFFLIYFVIALPYYSGDIKNHVAWGKSLLEQGSYGFFDRVFPGFSFPTYPPLIMYSFAFFYYLYEVKLDLTYFINSAFPFFPSNLVHLMEWENTLIAFLKLPGIIATIVYAAFIPFLLNTINEKQFIKKKYLIALVFLVNPGIIYLSAVWGQTDLVQNLFLLLAFEFLLLKKLWWSFVFAGISLVTKHTILLLWGVYIFYIFKEFGILNSLKAILVSLIIIYLSYLPFNTFSLTWPLEFYYSNFQIVDFGLSENAFNFWGSFSNFQIVSSHQEFLGISYNLWSYILFFMSVLPLTYILYKRKSSYYLLMYYLFLVSALSFFFLTKMHERYLIPAILFAGILAVMRKNHWINYIFFSTLFFLNLYRGLFQPDIPILNMLVTNIFFLNVLVFIYGIFLVINYYSFIKNKS